MLKSKVVEGQVLKSMEYLFTVHVAHLQTLVIDRICTVSCRVAVALPGEGRIVLVKKKECGNVLRKKKTTKSPFDLQQWERSASNLSHQQRHANTFGQALSCTLSSMHRANTRMLFLYR